MPERLYWTRISPDGPGLHLPKREGDIGWDLEAAETGLLYAGDHWDVPTNVRVALPPDHWGEIRARSSIARLGLQVDAGVIDNGYTGPLFVLLRNMHLPSPEDSGVVIKKGMRVAQLVLHRGGFGVVGIEVDTIPSDPRRGDAAFGSTGGL